MIRSFGLLFKQTDDGPDVIATDPFSLGRRIAIVLVVVVVVFVRIGRGSFVLVRRRIHVVEARFCALDSIWLAAHRTGSVKYQSSQICQCYFEQQRLCVSVQLQLKEVGIQTPLRGGQAGR